MIDSLRCGISGISVWTKLIRNNKVVQYLFNAEAFDFNYQFENRLPKPIKIFPVDTIRMQIIKILTTPNPYLGRFFYYALCLQHDKQRNCNTGNHV